MSDDELIASVTKQSYPLSISAEQAEALVRCISNIIEMVPEDDVPIIRGDYAAVTAALCHPEGPNNTNTRVEP